MHKILQEIVTKTRHDLVIRKERIPEETLIRLLKAHHPTSGRFRTAIAQPKIGNIALIAELKLASPTEAHLGSQEEILDRAMQYEQAGADAISVVTEPHFFKGSIAFIKKIKQVSTLPVLMKDFVVDQYQLYEACLIGSDAVLLIAQLLEGKQLMRLTKVALELGIEPLIELYDEADLEKISQLNNLIIGVNARDLDTFQVDIDHACKVLKKIPQESIKIGFSGVHSVKEVHKYKKAGAQAVLVGTNLMKSSDIQQAIHQLKGL